MKMLVLPTLFPHCVPLHFLFKIFLSLVCWFPAISVQSKFVGSGRNKTNGKSAKLSLAGLGSVQYFVQLYIEEAFWHLIFHSPYHSFGLRILSSNLSVVESFDRAASTMSLTCLLSTDLVFCLTFFLNTIWANRLRGPRPVNHVCRSVSPLIDISDEISDC